MSSTSVLDNQIEYRAISLLSLPIFAESRDKWQEWLAKTLQNQPKTDMSPALVFTPNAEQMVQAYQDPGFFHDLQQADLLLPDGVGPVLASYWHDRLHPMTERLAGADVVKDVLQQAKNRNLSILVVGGRGYGMVNQFGFANVSLPLANGDKIEVTWTPGYADVAHPTPSEHAVVRFVINQRKPAIVLVAFGAPWQEAWAVRHQELLTSISTRLVMVVGGAVDFLLGRVPRAPKLLQRFGLEWLFRLVLQPWRWQRQLRLVVFVGLLLLGKFKQLPPTSASLKKDAAWRD